MTNKNRDTTRIILDPPTFSPPPEMRREYLERLKAQNESLIGFGMDGAWKPVVTVMNHVRGTGAMYGFDTIGTAAEVVAKAVENGDGKCLELLEAYAKTVAEAYV